MNINRDVNSKRSDALSWHDYFMATAFLAAQRSKDPCSQVGACIVSPDKRLVAVGYNGLPTGCSDDEFPWKKGQRNAWDNKYLYVCHAEMNAILNKNSTDVKNCTMYVGLFPCNECAKLIIQAGIKEVVFLSDKHAHKMETKASKRMLDASGVSYWQLVPKQNKIVIDFEDINWNAMSQLPSTPNNRNLEQQNATSNEDIKEIQRDMNNVQIK